MPKNSSKLAGRADKAGLPPGSLVYIGGQRDVASEITVIDYSAERYDEQIVTSPEEARAYIDRDSVTWINLTGLNDVVLLREFGETFKIHPLVLEDIAHIGQRPRIDELDEAVFIVANMLYADADGMLVAEQLSLIVGAGYVLSFQEVPGDVFEVIRDRLRQSKGRIRAMGADYLAYALLDALVDNYFVVLEDMGERIEQLQTEVLETPRHETIETIHRMKREMIFLRRSLWPLRDVIAQMERMDEIIKEVTQPYLRDVFQHVIYAMDTIESLREMLNSCLDVYLTASGNRMNEVMRVLTVIATIFMPLTFVAGIYGMNFDNMPELHWSYGYFGVIGVMAVMAAGMIFLFRRRGWL